MALVTIIIGVIILHAQPVDNRQTQIVHHYRQELQHQPLNTMELHLGQKVILGLRPEHVTITEEPSMIGATVLTSLPSGMETIVQLKMGESYIHSVVFGDLDFDLEKQVGLSFSSGKFNLFDEQTKRNLGQGLLKKV